MQMLWKVYGIMWTEKRMKDHEKLENIQTVDVKTEDLLKTNEYGGFFVCFWLKISTHVL